MAQTVLWDRCLEVLTLEQGRLIIIYGQRLPIRRFSQRFGILRVRTTEWWHIKLSAARLVVSIESLNRLLKYLDALNKQRNMQQ